MTIVFTLVSLILLIFYTTSFVKKKNILLSFTGDDHQKKTVDISVPLIGGFILLILFSIIFFEQNHKLFLILLILIFIIGIGSDLKIISSPAFRILLQSIVVFIAVFFLDMSILTTRINFIDFAISNYYINIFFTIFCILILINGANLIDGLNGLVLGYFFIVFYFLFKLNFFTLYFLSIDNIILIVLVFVILLIFNFTNRVFIGDSGAYILGFVFGAWVIFLQHKLQNISPFYIILLLWYPCFENLFSIIRKLKFGKSPVCPDTSHLHQLIFFYLQKKSKFSKKITNNISSILINFYNFIILYIGSLNPYNTNHQLFIIFSSILIYLILYIQLFKLKKINK